MQTSPYEYYNNSYGVRLGFLVSDTDKRHHASVDLFSYGSYLKRAQRITGFRIKEGKGLGNEALVTTPN